ncbi:TPA: hypothetical protein ACFNUZ_002056, partial [Neisseria meningitidis]
QKRESSPQRNRNPSEKTETLKPSFPQKRESSPLTQQESIEKTETSKPSFPRKWESSNRKTTGIYRKKTNPKKTGRIPHHPPKP